MLLRSDGELTLWPASEVMTSPAERPAAAAGPPLTTLLMVTPEVLELLEPPERAARRAVSEAEAARAALVARGAREAGRERRSGRRERWPNRGLTRSRDDRQGLVDGDRECLVPLLSVDDWKE